MQLSPGGQNSRARATTNLSQEIFIVKTRGSASGHCKLEAAVSALELALVTERGRVLDLPNPLKSVN